MSLLSCPNGSGERAVPEYNISLFINGKCDSVETDLCEDEGQARSDLWFYLTAVLADEPERFLNARHITADLADAAGRVVWRLSIASGRLH